MPDKIIPQLTQLASNAVADDDLLVIYDVSAASTKYALRSAIGSKTLSGMSDISGSPSNGDVLVYNGSVWVVTDLGDIADNVLPSYTGNAGNVLAVNVGANGVEWIEPVVYPNFAGNAGKILSVSTSETGVEWIVQYPSFTGNAGKYLMVNSGGDGVEWSTVLPALTGNATKILAVNSSANGVEWVDAASGGAEALNDLTDVDTSGATTGQVLTRQSDGTYAFDDSAGGAEALDDLTDVNTAGATTGQVLTRQSDGSYAFDDVAAGVQISTDAGNLLTAGTDDGVYFAGTDIGSVVDLGNVSGALSIDLSDGKTFKLNLTGSVTITFTDFPATGVEIPKTFYVSRNSGSGATISFAQTIGWVGSLPPIMSDGLVTVFTISTLNAGSTIHGFNNGLLYELASVATDTTFNPSNSNTGFTFSSDNKTLTLNNNTFSAKTAFTFGGKTSGKWQWSIQVVLAPSLSNSGQCAVGFGLTTLSLSASQYVGQVAGSYGILQLDSSTGTTTLTKNKYNQGSATTFSAYPQVGTGAIVTILADLDAGKVWFAYNGVAMEGDPNAGTGESFAISIGDLYFGAMSYYANTTTGASQGEFKILNSLENPYLNDFPTFLQAQA